MKAILVLSCLWISSVYSTSMCDEQIEENCASAIANECCEWLNVDGVYCTAVPCPTGPSVTGVTTDCDNDSDMDDWTVDYIGRSTQFRIYDPCDNKFIKFKMEDLTEYTSDGSKTQYKETAFASTKDWTWVPGQPNSDQIINTFTADTLTKVDASFTLTTVFFRKEAEIPDPADNSQNITVNRNSLKFSVNISGWALSDPENYLELCVGIMTNKK
eukprot:UN08996